MLHNGGMRARIDHPALTRRCCAVLFAVALAGCSSSGAPSAPSADPSSPTASPTATATKPALPTPSPTPGPAWTAHDVVLLAQAGATDREIVHLGAGFPVTPTSAADTYLGAVWLEVRWQTPGRSGSGWVEETSLGFQPPAGMARAGVDALDADLAAYLGALGDRVGVEVHDLTRGTAYAYNEVRQFTTASSIKVPIMLAFLALCEEEGREPTAGEKALLTEMITKSMDYAATAMWPKVGGVAGLNEFTAGLGLDGLHPSKYGWSWSTISPQTMAELLAKLQDGVILNAAHRDYALYLMQHVIRSQRIGVADTAPKGATVAMKIGRWWYEEKRGGTIMSSSGIVTLGGETYVIAVYTDHNPSMPQAEATVRHICAEFARLLLPEAA